jgi:2-phospho-L-lactate guanylyltransferase
VTPPDWTVVIPVKPSARGKSRLSVEGVDRVALARAIALDTIAAAVACESVAQVVIVTDDGGLVLQAADIPGLQFVSDAAAVGLDAAVALGAATAEGMPRAALLGDLPALRPADLEEALEAAAWVDRGVVADAEGTGSTLVTAREGVSWLSAFGEGSLARHVARGCVPLEIPDASTLRRDVDTVEQLDTAVAHGVGPRTAAALRGLAIRVPRVEDIPAMARMHVQSWREAYRGLFSDAILDDPGFVERREQFWTDVLADEGGRRRAAVAVIDGAIVGLALSGPPEAADATRQLYCLYVLAAHHGTGAGAALLEAVVAAEDDVILWVADPNPRAQAFYRTHRFVADGSVKVVDDVREIRMRRRP